MSEHDIQKAIVSYLDLVLPADQRIVAVPNNPRSRVSGAFEKARGSRAGFPDLILVGRITGYLEVKTARGRLSEAQYAWAEWLLVDAEQNYATVRSIDDVAAALHAWGIKTRAGNNFGFERHIDL